MDTDSAVPAIGAAWRLDDGQSRSEPASRLGGRIAAERAQAGFSARLHRGTAPVAEIWRDWQREGRCTAYQRLEWVEGLIAHIAPGSGATPLIVEVVEAASGRPVMLLPLALVRRRFATSIEFLDLGVCDYAAPILAPGIVLSENDASRAWEATTSVLPHADLIRIARIPQRIFDARNPLAQLPYVRPLTLTASGFAIEGDPDTLLKRVCNRSTFKDIGRGRRRLQARGEMRFTAARTEAEVDALFDVLLEQRVNRFRELGRFDLLTRPDAAAFYRAAAKRGLADGLAQIFGISVDGEWIATAYGLVHNRAFHGILLAMAGEPWRDAGPGIMIISEIMVWARRRGLDYFDFTIGAMPYKRGFRPVERELVELVQIRTVRGRAIMAGRDLMAAAKDALERHPGAYERVRTARRLLRRLAGSGARPADATVETASRNGTPSVRSDG